MHEKEIASDRKRKCTGKSTGKIKSWHKKLKNSTACSINTCLLRILS
jgi:hypothetical protein